MDGPAPDTRRRAPPVRLAAPELSGTQRRRAWTRPPSRREARWRRSRHDAPSRPRGLRRGLRVPPPHSEWCAPAQEDRTQGRPLPRTLEGHRGAVVANLTYLSPPMSQPAHPLSRQARTLRLVHTSIGIAELGCLGYVWFCALSRHRDRWLNLSVGVLAGEGVALLLAKGCPLGVFQRRAGDDVPMFELWFGPRVAPIAIPSFTVIALAGLLLVVARPPSGDSETQR